MRMGGDWINLWNGEEDGCLLCKLVGAELLRVRWPRLRDTVSYSCLIFVRGLFIGMVFISFCGDKVLDINFVKSIPGYHAFSSFLNIRSMR